MLNEEAPDFSLDSTTGGQVHLKDLRGSYVVLVFYPANDSPTCNKQLDTMNLSAQDLFARNARIFGVNTAPATKSKEYCLRRKLDFPILSDPGGSVAKKYGAHMVWLPWNKRTVVMIDPKGKICFYKRGVPSPEEVMKAIA